MRNHSNEKGFDSHENGHADEEHWLPTNVARIRFPDPASYVGCVVGSHPSYESFSPGSPVSLPPQKPALLNSNVIGKFRGTGLTVARLLRATLVKQSRFFLKFFLMNGLTQRLVFTQSFHTEAKGSTRKWSIARLSEKSGYGPLSYRYFLSFAR